MLLMLLLAVSVIVLALGPLLVAIADRARSMLLWLDGFIMTAVLGLVVVHVVPHCMESIGAVAILITLVGFIGPGLVERYLHRAADQTHYATLLLACVGLLAHAFFDGAALTVGDMETQMGHGHGHGASLALAVVLHRLPVAITVWWLLRPSFGVVVAAGMLVSLALATVSGFVVAGYVSSMVDNRWVVLMQALVAGALLHVIVHRPPPLSSMSNSTAGPVISPAFYAGLGALGGLLLVWAIAGTHHGLHAGAVTGSFSDNFIMLAQESAPALLLGFILAGVVAVFLPQASMRWMRTGRASGEAMRGVAFGLPLPICSCGVVPLYRSLVGSGVPATAAMAFLVATPELGLDAILISLPLLGAELTAARVLAAVVLAFAIGTLIGRWVQPAPPPTDAAARAQLTARGTWIARLRLGIRYGLRDVVDDVGPWVLLGLVIAAFVEPVIDGQWLATLPWGVDVIAFALLGIPTYVCASGATPLAAVLVFKGISPGAALAFLLAGPATNITTFGILADLHGRRIAIAFAAAMATLAIAIGWAANLVIPEAQGLSLSEQQLEDGSIWSSLALIALAGVFAASLLRLGPRALIGQMMPNFSSGDHDHDHDHGHSHSHSHDHADYQHHDAGTAASADIDANSCCGANAAATKSVRG